MSVAKKILNYKTLKALVTRLRDDLNDNDFILLYAYNGTGKTRTSMAFKEKGKKNIVYNLKDKTGNELVDKKGKPETENKVVGDTLYFNAFTEDLFVWDNDLENDTERFLQIKSESKFFTGFKDLALDEKIFAFLERYATFDFDIDYDNWKIIFKKQIKNPAYNAKNPTNTEPEYVIKDHIKISRGEENLFIWCVFMAICELAIDAEEGSSYSWVDYIYVDDPISSLDDNNAIAVATDLAKLLKRGINKEIEDNGEKRFVKKDEDDNIVKSIVSSHHSLFFNVMCNEVKRFDHNRYFLHKNGSESHTLQKTDDTPFFHHVAILSELEQAKETGNINTYHFNSLRSILEKTATFFGLDDFSKCLSGFKDDALYERGLNLLSHGKYSIYEPVEMGDDNKELFKQILDAFLVKYKFNLPELLKK